MVPRDSFCRQAARPGNEGGLELKKKSAMFLTALAIFGGLAYNGMAAGVALADDPSVPDPQPSVTAGPVVPVAPDPQVESELAPRPWLRESIIVAAAQTIGVSRDRRPKGIDQRPQSARAGRPSRRRT